MNKRFLRLVSVGTGALVVFQLGALWSPEVWASSGQQASYASAVPKQVSQQELQEIYTAAGRKYDISWELLAAVDRYAQLTKTKQAKLETPYYGLAFADKAWVGIDNPNSLDVNPLTIKLFHGMGLDADGDGLALPWDEKDRIYALAHWLDKTAGEEGVDVRIWDLFQDPVAMDRIFAFQHIFSEFGLYPKGHSFPVSKKYNYTVKHTFGAGRSFGGRRIHEGVDIFASYGTPVLACSYGYVELKGWNRFGGWRLGLRDANNTYYYYAHLSSYAAGIKRGVLVRPGTVLGYVGSSGYGPPGTSGKFPPHLHFGVYQHTGTGEWAYSPSSLLAQWERLPQKVTKLSPERS